MGVSMSETKLSPVSEPAGMVPVYALGYGALGEAATPVDADHPLPTVSLTMPASAAALTGTVSEDAVVGPFAPELGRPIWVTLTGDWQGSVSVQRSLNGGVGRQPLTVGGMPWAMFEANANEPVGEESVAGATWWLAVTLASGTLGYEVRQ
jgi:hypothetical protein